MILTLRVGLASCLGPGGLTTIRCRGWLGGGTFFGVLEPGIPKRLCLHPLGQGPGTATSSLLHVSPESDPEGDGA